jgi:uncharacterized membrane protein
MKNNILCLVAALCFLVAGIIYLFFVEAHSVAFGGAFVALACAFVGVYLHSSKKKAK